MKIKGYATQALVYSIASEGNSWGGQTQLLLDGGGAKYAYYNSFQDNLALGGLSTSTNTTNFMEHMTIGVADPSVTNSATFYIQTTNLYASHFVFRDMLIANGGAGGTGSSYFEINMAGAGGPYGKIVLDGIYAEGGTPKYGLRVSTDAGTARTLTGLTLVNSALNSASVAFLYGEDNTTISDSNIENNYIATASSVYNFDFNKLQYRLQNFTVRNHAFQNDIIFDDDTNGAVLNLGTANKNRVFYQKSGTGITSAYGALVAADSFATSYTPDLAAGGVLKIILTDNVTINAPVNGKSGVELTLFMTQDGTGGRVVTWNGAYKTNWTPNTTAGKVNIITFVYDGTNWWQKTASTGL